MGRWVVACVVVCVGVGAVGCGSSDDAQADGSTDPDAADDDAADDDDGDPDPQGSPDPDNDTENGGASGGSAGKAGDQPNDGSGGSGGSGDSNPPPGDAPRGDASCEGLITDTDAHPMSPLDKPALLEAATDPEFGTRVVRVTDVESQTGGEVIKPLYSTVQAWNADESLLMLYEVGAGHQLYDGQTYEFIRRLNVNPPDLEQVYWHPREPDVLFYADGNELMRYSVEADSAGSVHRFDGCDGVSAGGDPMYISWDGNTFGFLCSGQAFVYRLDDDTESVRVDAPDLGPQVAPSGNTVYLSGDIYDRDMTLLRTLDLDNPYDHASLGQLASGADTLNIIAFDPGRGGSGVGTLVVFDLTTGEDTVVIGQDTGYPYPPSGTHISAVAHRAPGWVAVSVVGNDLDGQSVLDNELLLADTNTGEVCRIAHHRSHGKSGPQDYWAEPHASISPSATRVLFASDWGGGSSVDTYVVELPSYAP